jgi:hypothetical protein
MATGLRFSQVKGKQYQSRKKTQRGSAFRVDIVPAGLRRRKSSRSSDLRFGGRSRKSCPARTRGTFTGGGRDHPGNARVTNGNGGSHQPRSGLRVGGRILQLAG